MDFGKILDSWDKQQGKKKPAKKDRTRDALETWLDSHPEIEAQEEHDDWAHENVKKAEARAALRQLRPQDTLDLHGVKSKDVQKRVDEFLRASRGSGYKKVQIIHGKGHHSQHEPVLPRTVAEVLRNHPLAGEVGFSERKDGGRGATWVIIRYRSR